MHRIGLALISVMAVAGCGGGGSSNPASQADQARAAVQRYIDALGAKDPRAACAAMSVQSQQATGGTGQTCVTNIQEAIAVNQATSFKGARADSAKVSGSHAIVRVNLANGGITHLPAVLEHGRWKYEASAL